MDEKEKDIEESQQKEDGHSEGVLESGVFTPALYKQRYSLVADILRKEHVKSVADFGVAECKVLMYFKNIDTVENIKGVDIDCSLLERYEFLINPLTTDYLQRRDKPLLIELLCGSIAEYDDRLADVEAVTMIEIIEHLEADTLEKFPHNVFGMISPRLVVITTPNSEYNVLFPNFSGFRHWDHKFEWTRQEFQDWCGNVATRYHYTVTYTGVGYGGEGTDHLGHCTQIAVFTRLENCDGRIEDNQATNGQIRPYKLVAQCRHPCRQDTGLSPEEEILHEAQYYIYMLINYHKQQQLAPDPVIESTDDTESDNCELLEIPLEKLLSFHKMKQKCDDLQKLGNILEEHGMRLSEDRLSVVVNIDPDDEESDGLYEEDSTSNCTDDNTTQAKDHNVETADEENWDEESSDCTTTCNTYTRGLNNSQHAVEHEEDTAEESWEDQWDGNGRDRSLLPPFDRYTGPVYGQFIDANEEEIVASHNCDEQLRNSSQCVLETDLGEENMSDPQNVSSASVECERPFLKRYKTKFVYSGEKLYSTQYNYADQKCLNSSETSDFIQAPYLGSELSSQETSYYPISSTQLLSDPVNSCTQNSSRYNGIYDPSLRIHSVITCEGCGCEMRQLRNGVNLCGMSRKCRSNWTDKFAGDFNKCVTVADTGIVEGQFSDAELDL